MIRRLVDTAALLLIAGVLAAWSMLLVYIVVHAVLR